jgi:hypothetical protein
MRLRPRPAPTSSARPRRRARSVRSLRLSPTRLASRPRPCRLVSTATRISSRATASSRRLVGRRLRRRPLPRLARARACAPLLRRRRPHLLGPRRLLQGGLRRRPPVGRPRRGSPRRWPAAHPQRSACSRPRRRSRLPTLDAMRLRLARSPRRPPRPASSSRPSQRPRRHRHRRLRLSRSPSTRLATERTSLRPTFRSLSRSSFSSSTCGHCRRPA